MTQKELAGGRYSVSYMSAIERGRVKPPPAVLKWCAQQLGVPVATLESGEDSAGDRADALQATILAYEQVHAQMLAISGDATRAREKLDAIRRRMGTNAPRLLGWFAAYAACREGNMDVALREAEAYVRDVEADADDRGRAAAHWLFGFIYARQRDTVRAVAEYQRALDMEDRAYFDPDAAMTIRGHLSRLLLALGDVSAVAALDKEALEEYGSFADPAARVKRAYALAEETAREGNWVKAYRFIRWAWLSQREEAARHVAAQAYLRSALVGTHDDGTTAEDELRQALLLADQSADKDTRLLAACLLALRLAGQGDAVAARQVITSHIADDAPDEVSGEGSAHETIRETAQGMLLAAQGWIAHVEGDAAGARARAQQSERFLRETPDEMRFYAAAAYTALARLYEALDDSKAALVALWRALALRTQGGFAARQD